MLKVDLHIHSVHSGHGFGTIYDIARDAAAKKMELIAVTDHGPGMQGTITSISLELGDRAPRRLEGVRMLWGCEANILNADGELDVDPLTQEKLDLILVNIHEYCGYHDLGIEGNTSAFLRALHNPNVRIISHPADCKYPYDWEKVLVAALERGIVPELNLSILKRRSNGIETNRRMVEIVKHQGGRLIVNSDAHFLHEIGDDRALRENWDVLGVEEELLLNNYPADILKWLRVEE